MQSFVIESLELRRLLAVDLSLGDFVLSGSPLFQPGGVTTVTLFVRGATGTTAPTVGFKYIDVGFRGDDEKFSYDDPTAIALTATAKANTPVGIGGRSLSFDVSYSAKMAQGRYALLAKVDEGNAIVEANELNNTLALGSGRVLPKDGNLLIAGTNGGDRISITPYLKNHQQRYTVQVDNDVESFSGAKISAFKVQGRNGDDVIALVGAIPHAYCDGGDGDDLLVGGELGDTLVGGAGKDTLYGGDGDDRLNGNGGNDRLYGEAGVDRLYGYAGNDYLDAGAGSDRLEGGKGLDTLLGQGGNDRFFATGDHAVDQLFGGSGSDTEESDATDVRSSIENHTPQ